MRRTHWVWCHGWTWLKFWFLTSVIPVVKPCVTVPSVGISRHRLHTPKETTQPNNKAPRRTLLFGSFVFLVMTVPAERPLCRDTRSIHTPHYCGQFHTVAGACEVSSHQLQRKITQLSLSLHFHGHCFMFWAANPYWLLGLAELLHDLTVCFIPRERKPFHFLQI